MKFPRRNSKVGYCQGLNGVVAYFIQKELQEEECFWILVYILEELMPKDYYSNMLSLRSDIQITYKILSLKDPQLIKHFAEVSIDISLITVESFLTLYTNTCHPDIVEVIMDHLFIHGSNVLIKTMCILLGYMREDLLKADNLGMKN